MHSWSERRTCWHRQRPRDRIQFGEAAVPVGSSSRIVSILSRKKNFVVVSATSSGTHDPRQALESVSEKEPHTFHNIVRHCVALSVVNCFFALSQSPRLDKLTVSCWKHCLVVRRVHVRAGSLRRQDGCESADDSFRKILSMRPGKIF